MKLLKKFKLLVLLDYKTKLLFIESFLFLGWARVMKTMSFTKVATHLGKQMTETDFIGNEDDRRKLVSLSQAINIMSRYTPWESHCLVKAIAAMKMLERRKIECTLYLGTAKDEAGVFIAHAWLRSGPLYITGYEGKERFSVVGSFAKTFTSQKS